MNGDEESIDEPVIMLAPVQAGGALARQRNRRANRSRIDYYPDPAVMQQLQRFKAARRTEPLQGVIDLLVMKAAASFPEGQEGELWP